MSAYPTGQFMGNKTLWFTDAQLQELADKDPAFYNLGLTSKFIAANYFTLTLPIYTAIGNVTGYSMALVAPFPFLAWRAEVGCEAAAGSTAVGFLQKALAADPASFSTLTENATTDIKAAAGTLQAVGMDLAKASIAYGDVVRYAITGSTGGNVTGGLAIVHCARL
jgi:hypothetical protein